MKRFQEVRRGREEAQRLVGNKYGQNPTAGQKCQEQGQCTPAQPAAECVYLNVLVPTDTKTFDMPKCSVEQKDGAIIVKVGDLTHTFGAEK